MNTNTGIIIGIIGLVVVVGGVYASMSSKDEIMVDEKTDDSAMIEKNETDVMEEKKEVTVGNDDVMMKVGSYEAYSAEKIALAETGDVVLFFHASWCPSCRGLNSDIEANLQSIPEGVTILKVDYDKETELKKKYGITSQHTLVQVDKDGNLINKWSGSPKLSNLVSQIQ